MKALRRLLVITAVLLAAVAVARLVTNPVKPRLRVENFSQVTIGMSQAEVEALLGGPPGNFGKHSRERARMTCEGTTVPENSTERVWCDDNTRFEICFDRQGRVVHHYQRAGYQQTPPEGLISRLRQRLGL